VFKNQAPRAKSDFSGPTGYLFSARTAPPFSGTTVFFLQSRGQLPQAVERPETFRFATAAGF
jgi:hypothetical protein